MCMKRLIKMLRIDDKNSSHTYIHTRKTTKSGTNEKKVFIIGKYRHLEYKSDNPGYVTTATFIDGIVKHSFN